jgi:hypothetical protein
MYTDWDIDIGLRLGARPTQSNGQFTNRGRGQWWRIQDADFQLGMATLCNTL